MRIIHFFLLATLLTAFMPPHPTDNGNVLCRKIKVDYPEVFCHRGCWFPGYVPENSVDGVIMAARLGYPTIECDIHFTKDGELVVMHDKTINRTMRNAVDYSEIDAPVSVEDTDFRTLRENYVLASSDPAMRKPIPTAREILSECSKQGIKPILHCNIYEGYSLAKEILGDGFIAFTSSFDLAKRVRSISKCLVLLDPNATNPSENPDDIIPLLEQIGGDCGISSMRYPMLRKEMCDALKKQGYQCQSSIFKTPHDLDAIRDGATIMLSDFLWLQPHRFNPTETFREKRMVNIAQDNMIAAGSPEIYELGAIFFSFECEGEGELLFGDRVYPISNEKMGRITLGFRIHDAKPLINIRAKNGSLKVRDVLLETFKF